jgi:hypothetical protein
MLLQNLPPAKMAFAASGLATIHKALREALNNKHVSFTYITVVKNEPQSIRVFLTGEGERDDFVDLPHPFSPLEMADELVRFSREDARYPELPQGEKIHLNKGWLIKRVDFDGRPGVVAIATWVAAS